MNTKKVRTVILAGAATLSMDDAYSHAVINEGKAAAGNFSFVTLRITHGFGASPSNQIRMKIPEGVTRVLPRYLERWQVKKKLRTLETPYMDEVGQSVTETVDEIVWSGGALPEGYYGEFQFQVLMPDEPGRMLWFKTIQNCDDGGIRWIEGH